MSAGTLTKTIPSRQKTVEFLWIKRDFMAMSQRYRDVRKTCSSPMDVCFWCQHKFQGGEMMGLAAVSGKLNKVLCHTCIDAAQTRESTDE